MNRTVFIYGAILMVALAGSWIHYTSDEASSAEGVVLVDGTKDDLRRLVYDGPDVDVTFEQRADDFGKYGWVTLAETKKKKVDGVDTTELKTSTFKSGAATDDLVTSFAPLLALRSLDEVDDARLTTFGLKDPDTFVEIVTTSRTTKLALGGETYGTRDRYVRDEASQRVFVVDDETFKRLKLAGSKLADRSLATAKIETMTEVTLGEGTASATWVQKNRDDRKAAYWERTSNTTKDDAFDNWIEKMLKVKSTEWVGDAARPPELVSAFDVTIKADDAKPETVRVSRAGDDWYASSESTRGLVKLTKSSASDVAGDVADVIAGNAPAEAPAAAGAPPPSLSPSAPPPSLSPGAPPVGGIPPRPAPPGH